MRCVGLSFDCPWSKFAALRLERAKASDEGSEKSRMVRAPTIRNRGTRNCHHFDCGRFGDLLSCTPMAGLLGFSPDSPRALDWRPLVPEEPQANDSATEMRGQLAWPFVVADAFRKTDVGKSSR